MQNQVPKNSHRFSRRGFVQAGSTIALTASSWRRSLGANERIQVGMIGYGLIGHSHLEDFKEQPDVDLMAISETHRGRMEQAAALMGRNASRYKDFRDLLDNKDIDAVIVSTPDHWHALHTMLACAAGKDVYVEKPMTLFVKEGRWMVDVAKRYRRIVQVGAQQRSGKHYQQARELIRQGKLGKVVSIHDDYHRNLMPGLGYPPDQDPPVDLDWDMFLGPAPARPYNLHRGIYHFRWFWDYSGGQMTNFGAHSMDIVYYYMDVKGPTSVTSIGDRSILKDNCETTDNQDTIFEFPGFRMVVSLREYCLGEGSNPLGFYGTNGSLLISRSGFKLTPDKNMPPVDVFPGVKEGDHPIGGPIYDTETLKPSLRTEPVSVSRQNARNLLKLHARNFLDCVKSRQTPISDVENGHRVATVLHLANLSARIGRRIVWDAEKEEIVGDEEANCMIVRPYRPPWDAELKSLNVT